MAARYAKKKNFKNFNYPQQGLYVRNDLPTLAPKKSLNLETGWEFSKNPNPWEGPPYNYFTLNILSHFLGGQLHDNFFYM